MDDVIGDGKQLTKPFDFDINLLVDHFDDVQYMHIGKYLFSVKKGGNPLGFKSSKGKDLISIEEEFGNARATFYIRKREKDQTYSVILHVYGLQRKPDDNFASLTIPGLAPVVEDRSVNEDASHEENGIEILGYEY